MFHTDSIASVCNSISNKVTGLGKPGYDSIGQLEIDDNWIFQNTRFLYDTFYHNLWQVRRVIDLRPYQMGNAWGEFTVTDGDAKKIDKVNRFISSLKRKYQHGQMLANKDGIATIVRIVDDGQEDFSQPINVDNIKSIRYSRVFDRWEIFPDPKSYQGDIYNPEYYWVAINPTENFGDMASIGDSDNFYTNLSIKAGFKRIHRDRILRFRGNYINSQAMERNHGCESSILPGFLMPLMRYLEAIGHIGESLKSFEFVVYMIAQLHDKLTGSINDTKSLRSIEEKFRANRYTQSTLKAMVVDKDLEDIKVVSRNFSGVDKVIDKLILEMKGASGLDDIELFQEHPQGLQATGQSERMEKALKIMMLCDYEWSDNLIGVSSEGAIGDIGYYLLSDESPFKSDDIADEWSWQWNSAIELTPLEKAEVKEKYAQIDQINIESGVYDAATASQRYQGTKFNTEINLDDSTE